MMISLKTRKVEPSITGIGFVVCTTAVYILIWKWSIDLEWGTE